MLRHISVLLRSTLLDRHGFRHAFATRAGGVSRPPFATLNLGFGVGDDEGAVHENRTRFGQAVGAGRWFEQRQVHGKRVSEVGRDDAPESIARNEGDALIARAAGVGVAIRTADCVPVLIGHRSTGCVAAVHAGWRGAVAGVVPAAVDALGEDPSELVVAIGPHIRASSFEIGSDVAEQMTRASLGAPVVEWSRPKPYGDLGALIVAQLQQRGVPGNAIDDVGGCTYAEPAKFFSHRRDDGRTGRHLSMIVAGSQGGSGSLRRVAPSNP